MVGGGVGVVDKFVPPPHHNKPGTSTSSATTHNSRKGKSKSSSKQPTVKRSKQQQSFFAGKAYLKINSLVKTPLHEFMVVAHSGLWAPASVKFQQITFKLGNITHFRRSFHWC